MYWTYASYHYCYHQYPITHFFYCAIIISRACHVILSATCFFCERNCAAGWLTRLADLLLTDLAKNPKHRRLAHLIGLLTTTIPAVLPAPLHYRALQRLKEKALRNSRHNHNTVISLDEDAAKDLDWWIAHASGPMANLAISQRQRE